MPYLEGLAMEQVFTTNWVFRQSSAPVQKQAEDYNKKAHALIYSVAVMPMSMLILFLRHSW